MKHNKMLAVLLATVMALTAVGCGSKATTENPAPAAESKKERRRPKLRQKSRQTGKRWKSASPGGVIPRGMICTMRSVTDLRRRIPILRL